MQTFVLKSSIIPRELGRHPRHEQQGQRLLAYLVNFVEYTVISPNGPHSRVPLTYSHKQRRR